MRAHKPDRLTTANPNQIIDGHRRGHWVREAARAIIATTDPAARFLILKAGFPKFQLLGKIKFPQETKFEFTSAELRWMFDYVHAYVMRKERHLIERFEQAYQQSLRKNTAKAVESEQPDRISTTKVEDGFLKERVH